MNKDLMQMNKDCVHTNIVHTNIEYPKIQYNDKLKESILNQYYTELNILINDKTKINDNKIKELLAVIRHIDHTD